MLKKTALILYCVQAIACGGYDDDGLDPDLAQLQQGYQAVSNVRFGTRTSSAGLECVGTDSTHVCAIPARKALRFFMQADGATSAQVQLVRSKINTWSNAAIAAGLLTQGIDSWSISEASSNDNTVTHVFVVHAETANQACNGAGTGSNNIENYACLAGATINIAEDPGVVANYVVRVKATVHVDLADILAKGTTATQDDNIHRHAVFNVILKTLGLGSHEFSNALCSSRPINSLTLNSACIMQTNQMCGLNSFTELNDTTSFGYTNQICRDDPSPS
jgi:hypothetical protein